MLRWMLVAGILATAVGDGPAPDGPPPGRRTDDNVVSGPVSAARGLGALARASTVTAPPATPPASTSTVGAGGLAVAPTAPQAAAGSASPAARSPAAPDALAGPPYVVAASSLPVRVHQTPSEDSPARLLDPSVELTGQLVFLVKQDGPDWLEVYLPLRPNGSTGWLRAGDVQLYEHGYRIELSLAQRRLQLFQGDDVVLDEPIGVGSEQTPTPGGVYYLKELLRAPDPASFYGSYAYGLSGFSNVLVDFAGGEGVVGLHGTNDPSSIGRNVTNGCIRLHNATMTKLVEEIGLPLGTPVVVRA